MSNDLQMVTRQVDGLILIDHGSRRPSSNLVVERMAELLASRLPLLVEPAHMELAEPDMATAYRRCVEAGARRIAIAPFFLAPGRHWDEDLPRLATAAAAEHPGTSVLVAAPLGVHDLLCDVLLARVTGCLAHQETRAGCDACADDGGCRWIGADAS